MYDPKMYPPDMVRCPLCVAVTSVGVLMVGELIVLLVSVWDCESVIRMYRAPPMLQPPTAHWLSVSSPKYAAYTPSRWEAILDAPEPALLISSWPSLPAVAPMPPVAMRCVAR